MSYFPVIRNIFGVGDLTVGDLTGVFI